MSIGSILVGLAGLLVTAAYVARPFRPAPNPSGLIDAWVAAARRGAPASAACPSCGADVEERDRFCRTCGAPLGRARDTSAGGGGGAG